MSSQEINEFEKGSPGRRLSILHRMNMAYLSEPLSKLGISRSKLPFLMRILCCEGIVQEDLTRFLVIDRAATARALQALEKEGLAVRKEDPDDRRCKRVYPTDRARSMQDDVISVLEQQNETLFNGFGAGERKLFLEMLDRLVENMRLELTDRKTD